MKRLQKILWIVLSVVLMALAFVPSVLAKGTGFQIVIGDVTAPRVIAFTASLLALLWDYFPPLAKWFDALSIDQKRLWTVGTAIAVVAIAFTLTCLNFISTSLVCTTSGAWDALSGIIYVIVLQYAFHQATKPTARFKANVLGIK